MLFWDIKYFLADHNLNYSDKLSMSQGVEVRVPYLDKDLVEFSTRLPVNYKMKGSLTKYILRKTITELPLKIRWRKDKKGFTIKEDNFISTSNLEKINQLFSHSLLAKNNIEPIEACTLVMLSTKQY